MTAVKRVDFRLHTPIVSGLMNNATAVERAPSHPAKTNENKREKSDETQSQHSKTEMRRESLIGNDSQIFFLLLLFVSGAW